MVENGDAANALFLIRLVAGNWQAPVKLVKANMMPFSAFRHCEGQRRLVLPTRSVCQPSSATERVRPIDGDVSQQATATREVIRCRL